MHSILFTHTCQKGEKVISQAILNVNTLCARVPRSLIAKDRYTSAVSEELCLHTAMCTYIDTTRRRAQRAARGVLHAALNHDKSSFYIRLLEEVTDLRNCQEERVATCCPEDAKAPGGTASSRVQPAPPGPSPSRRSSLPNHQQTQLHQADSRDTTYCHRNSFAPHSSALW